MDSPWIAALVALFAWWFSTGAILWVVKRADQGPDRHLWSVIWGLPLLAAGLWGLMRTLTEDTVQGAYGAFLSALAIWGWIELAFLSGIVTGPNRRKCPANTPEWERFIRAWGTVAYHEMLLVATLFLIALVTVGAANPFCLWTFAVLYFARISAKLNLFFGVPKINVQFLPLPLFHLPSHFRIARVNWFLPVSITVLSLAVGCWMERVYSSPTPAHAVGFGLLAALTALALLEHWLMVLPLPDEKLWRWAIPAPRPTPRQRLSEDANGL